MEATTASTVTACTHRAIRAIVETSGVECYDGSNDGVRKHSRKPKSPRQEGGGCAQKSVTVLGEIVKRSGRHVSRRRGYVKHSRRDDSNDQVRQAKQHTQQAYTHSTCDQTAPHAELVAATSAWCRATAVSVLATITVVLLLLLGRLIG